MSVILPRRVLPQPSPALHGGGDCGACILAGLVDVSVDEAYRLFHRDQKVEAFSWSEMAAALWRARAEGLVDRLVEDIPSWFVPEALQVWGQPAWQQGLAWYRYVRMALDGGYYGIAAVDSQRRGPLLGNLDHWVLIVGCREREEAILTLPHATEIIEEVLISNSSTQAPAAEEWVQRSDFLRLWGGYNVLLARPTARADEAPA